MAESVRATGCICLDENGAEIECAGDGDPAENRNIVSNLPKLL